MRKPEICLSKVERREEGEGERERGGLRVRFEKTKAPWPSATVSEHWERLVSRLEWRNLVADNNILQFEWTWRYGGGKVFLQRPVSINHI